MFSANYLLLVNPRFVEYSLIVANLGLIININKFTSAREARQMMIIYSPLTESSVFLPLFSFNGKKFKLRANNNIIISRAGSIYEHGDEKALDYFTPRVVLFIPFPIQPRDDELAIYLLTQPSKPNILQKHPCLVFISTRAIPRQTRRLFVGEEVVARLISAQEIMLFYLDQPLSAGRRRR